MSQVLDAILRRSTNNADATALSDNSVSIGYSSLSVAMKAAARTLTEACPGNRPIALIADNSAAWVVIDLAMILLQRPLVPLPLFLTEEQQRHAIGQTGCEWIVRDRPHGPAGMDKLVVAGTALTVEKCDSASVDLPPATAKITFTSGTTGRPKGVCLCQVGMECVATSLVRAIGQENAGIHLAILPLGILLENVAGVYATFMAGGHYRALPQAEIGFGKPFQPDFQSLIDALSTTQAATAIMVPEILRGVIATLDQGTRRLPDLKYLAVGGARVPEVLLRRGHELGLPVYQGYGLSEAASVLALNTKAERRDGSVGRVLSHAEVRIAEDCEIIVRNPIFLGYVGGEKRLDDFATGDIGRIDADGFVYIEGRKSNVIVTGFGRNISPEWIEGELTALPEIAQAMVFGDAAPALSALIVAKTSSLVSDRIAGAISLANESLPDYARIKKWILVPPFTPQNGLLTENGRMRRGNIRERYGDQMNQLQFSGRSNLRLFERLVDETKNERRYLLASEQIQKGLAGQISLHAYLRYLGEAYHHVRHTVPLMKSAMSRLAPDRAWLAEPLAEYISEETGHEEWILDDIRNAGGDAEVVRNGIPGMATEFMLSYAYDFINRINPVGIFGMVFVLESTSTQLATQGAMSLMESLGLPPECFSYLRSHGSLDMEHMKYFESLADRIDNAADQDAIVYMARRIYVLFANLFRSISLENTDCHAFR
jgi:long-subunit acyl-CoA synthetase (AMP-forming)